MDYFKLFDFISTKKSFTSENRQEQLSDLFAFLGSESFQAMPIRTLWIQYFDIYSVFLWLLPKTFSFLLKNEMN